MINLNLNKAKLKYDELIVYDPGGTTGFARFKIDYINKIIRVIEIGQFPTWSLLRAHVEYIRSRELGSIAVVYESFTVRTLNAVCIPLEIIGIIRFLCLENEIHHFPQQPSDRLISEKWFPNNMPHFPSHSGSAVRHGIFFAVKHLFNSELPKLSYDIKELKNNEIK